MKKLLFIPITIILYYSSIAQVPAYRQVTERNISFSDFNYLNRPYAYFISSPNTGYSFSDSSNQIADGSLNHIYNISNNCDSVLIQLTLNMAPYKSATVYVNNLLGFQKVYMTTGYKQLYVTGETIQENTDFHYSLIVPNSQKQHNKSIVQIAISFHSMPHTGGNCIVSGLKIIDIINNQSTVSSIPVTTISNNDVPNGKVTTKEFKDGQGIGGNNNQSNANTLQPTTTNNNKAISAEKPVNGNTSKAPNSAISLVDILLLIGGLVGSLYSILYKNSIISKYKKIVNPNKQQYKDYNWAKSVGIAGVIFLCMGVFSLMYTNSSTAVSSSSPAEIKRVSDSIATAYAKAQKAIYDSTTAIAQAKYAAYLLGTAFETVQIGSQIWTKQNLNVSTFRNGEPIPEARTDEEWKEAGRLHHAAWCYYKNDPNNAGVKWYGKLYNYWAVVDKRGLAPKGFHIPNKDEWTIFLNFLGEFLLQF